MKKFFLPFAGMCMCTLSGCYAVATAPVAPPPPRAYVPPPAVYAAPAPYPYYYSPGYYYPAPAYYSIGIGGVYWHHH